VHRNQCSFCPRCAALLDDLTCTCGWSAGSTLRRKLIIAASIAVAGCCLWFTCGHVRQWFPDKAAAADHNAKGKDFLEHDQPDSAIQEFRQAVSLDPDDAQSHQLLSKALDESGQTNQALAEIEIAAKLAPDNYDINYKYVAFLEDEDKLTEAAAIENKLLTLHPRDANLKRQASWLYEQLGDKSKALSLMKDAVHLDPRADHGWYSWAALLDDMGNTKEAITVLRKGIKVLPNSESLYYELGLLLSSSKHPTDAIVPLKEAVALDEEDEDAARLLEKVTKAAGKPVYLVKLKKVGLSYIADVVINEKVHTKLVVDSGATGVVISNGVARKLGADLSSAPAVPFGSATGDAVGHQVMLGSLRVGDAVVSNIRSIAYDSPSQDGEEGLLGMSFLSHFKFTLDADKAQLWLSNR
jgi:clan AA aspartic protease (TIGR02281 family)